MHNSLFKTLTRVPQPVRSRAKMAELVSTHLALMNVIVHLVIWDGHVTQVKYVIYM